VAFARGKISFSRPNVVFAFEIFEFFGSRNKADSFSGKAVLKVLNFSGIYTRVLVLKGVV